MTHALRIYPLDPRELTEEQLAVVFAMTSRRPEPFDEIARKEVLGGGHGSARLIVSRQFEYCPE